MKYIHIILLFLSMALCGYSAKALEMHIPAKPDSFICDPVHLFTETASHVLLNDLSDFDKIHHCPLYIVTVDSNYWSHIDTFIQLLCTKWQICGNDHTMLIVESNDCNYSRVLVVGDQLTNLFNDTITSYIANAEVKSITVLGLDPSEVPESMITRIADHMNSPYDLTHTDEYKEFKTYYGRTDRQASFHDFKSNLTEYIVGFVLVFLLYAIVIYFAAGKKDKSYKGSNFSYFIRNLWYIPVLFISLTFDMIKGVFTKGTTISSSGRSNDDSDDDNDDDD